MPTKPAHHSYWVIPNKFLVGEYPDSEEDFHQKDKIRKLLSMGVNYFIDLTEIYEKGLEPYAKTLEEEASRFGITVGYERISILDFDIPSPQKMRRIQDVINLQLNNKKTIFVHCYAGIGRTGTVVGCFLAERGFSQEKAMMELNRLQEDTPYKGSITILTMNQRKMIQSWPPDKEK